ncbi:MAG TPA: hypothetical protein VKA46_31405 [Gemmataceae bacterium]|nr:hypothetical protein [Gemmataceae bacterium]
MDLSKLAALKVKLLTAKHFGEVTGYFLDHFGDHPAFIKLGEPTRDDFIDQVLAQVAAQLFGRSVVIRDIRLVRLPEYEFVHGGFCVEGKVGTIIYFEDERKGLISLAWSLSPPETKYARFTGRPVPNSWLRSDN